jgi:4-hydroxyproline epimerase
LGKTLGRVPRNVNAHTAIVCRGHPAASIRRAHRISRMKPERSLLRIPVLDSHTAGEPTRLVMEGAPDLGGGPVAHQLAVLRDQHDVFRRRVLLEPRGSDILVGALLCPPQAADCTAGIIFFNNAGYLGMCGHGTIGVMVSLAHAGKVAPGVHRLETPVGVVTATLHDAHRVTVRNVASYRSHTDVRVDVPGYGLVTGDIAWGGNWFFLAREVERPLTLANCEALTAYTRAIRRALRDAGITGDNGGEIDHIELYGKPDTTSADSRNFVLCPGDAYDRSPCGTGTSARLACLCADGKLQPGQIWWQQGILGTMFEGAVSVEGEAIVPSITGAAYVTGETTLIFDPDDPLRDGISGG